jgi:hypothetical protein
LVCHGALTNIKTRDCKKNNKLQDGDEYTFDYGMISPAKGVFYPSTSDLKLNTFADSDWASCAITRKSITCFCVFIVLEQNVFNNEP